MPPSPIFPLSSRLALAIRSSLSHPSLPSVVCGLGVGDGTRLSFFRDFARSRCFRWDETVVFPGFEQSRCLRWDETAFFPGFCAVSVLGMGRDCGFSGVLRGLGAGEGTRLSLPFQVRPAFGGWLAYRAFVREDGVAVLLLSSRRRGPAVVFAALGVGERRLVLQDGIAAVKCKALSLWAL